MLKKIIKWLKILKIKWIKGQCHHMCAFCSYRHECLEHFEE